MIDFMTITTYQ